MSAGYGGGGPPPGGGGFGGPQGAPGGYVAPPPAQGAYGPPPAGGAFAQAGHVMGGQGAPRQPGASEGTVGEMFSNFGLLLKRSMSGIAWVYLMFAIVTFLFGTLPYGIVNTLRIMSLGGSDPIISFGMANILGSLASMLLITVSLIVGTAQAGLGRAARIALVDGKDAVGGFGGAMKAAFARFFHVLGNLFFVGLAVILGLLMCVLPGIAVMFLLMAAPFLTAARDEGPFDALMHSGRLTTKFIAPCLVLTVIVVVVGGIMAGVNFGMTAAVTALLGMEWAPLLSTVISQLIGLPLGLAMWLLAMATFTTIETAESGVAIKP